ncbi:glutamine amidotransferase [Corynebacterium halotolerans]|uniref:Glutamine amidotransferase n=1 Tax=Corynebacterium halotolerans YIM 70093 = DSM 44683 TaxID=1121362 RepID=M1NSU0_9CORY|nr:glutamine amidotransferase [Corynebacterium halotolerans]AGF72507.1 glutamine amidotransferase [Corynebacterium halotolerans YIM 70093 = DSM 44683]
MASILLLSLRADSLAREVAAAEYRDFLQATGLRREELTLRMLDSTEATVGDVSGFDGVVVGGSAFNITDAHWSPLQRHIHSQLVRLTASDIPVFFVCYGNSWLAHATGGRIGDTHPENSGPTLVELTDAGREDVLTRDLPIRFTSLTGHKENIVEVSQQATVLATGPTCPVQMIRVGADTWASQFHVEMDAVAMKARMDFYYDYGYFSPGDYETIVAGLPSVDTTFSHRLLQNFVSHSTRVRAYV